MLLSYYVTMFTTQRRTYSIFMYNVNRVNKIQVTSPLTCFSTEVTCIDNRLLDYEIVDMFTVKV